MGERQQALPELGGEVARFVRGEGRIVGVKVGFERQKRRVNIRFDAFRDFGRDLV